MRKKAGLCCVPRGERRWPAAALLADVLLLAVQICVSLGFDGQQLSDARSYLDLARYCAENKTWYPSGNDLFAPYIFGNGYVNLLAACMRVEPGDLWVPVLNIIFTQAIVFASADMAYQLTGRRKTASITIMLLCLMAGLWGEAVSARTELCFMAFACLSLCLLLRGGTGGLFVSGVLLAISNWVRPLLVVYFPAAMFNLLYRRAGILRIAGYCAGVLCVIALIGAGSQARTSRFVFQAQTMGVNMLMGANDEADGSYIATLYEEGGAGDLDPQTFESVTFDVRDAVYRERAVAWILDHPVRFISLAPVKLFYFLATDTYGGSAFFNHEIETDNLAYLLELWDILMGRGERTLAVGDLVVIFSQLTYMFVFVMYLFSIVDALKKRYILEILPLHIIFVLACGVTVLTVGGARYHLPYLPIFCICAAMMLDRGISRKGA